MENALRCVSGNALGDFVMEDRIKNRKWLPFFALTCSVLWALAYPLIKLGYVVMEIAGDDPGSKILFAGVRFGLAGVLVLILRGAEHGRSGLQRSVSFQGWVLLLLFTLVNTSLHYFCSYVGLGHIPSARGTIIDSTGSFLLILLSCALFADDTMSRWKAFGCVLGFLGVVILNVQPGNDLFAGVSFLGDGMIFLNAVCAAVGGVLSRIVSQKMDMIFATGFSMAAGGGILCAVGLLAGLHEPWRMSAAGMGILIALILISAISFRIYNSLLAYHPISTVAIYNAFIPIFGVILSTVILKEPFTWRYLLAGVIVAGGIVAVNRKSEPVRKILRRTS